MTAILRDLLTWSSLTEILSRQPWLWMILSSEAARSRWKIERDFRYPVVIYNFMNNPGDAQKNQQARIIIDQQTSQGARGVQRETRSVPGLRRRIHEETAGRVPGPGQLLLSVLNWTEHHGTTRDLRSPFTCFCHQSLFYLLWSIFCQSPK